jgi:hypothetical protein|tara:strand:+ start:16358 stop:16741 length:384 start_codon:yes stop_codon:yes gene_type:complete
VSLVARHLEEKNIPTVVIGSALDIIKTCVIPRYLHVDFPLGNPCGKPNNIEMQNAIFKQALALFNEKIETPLIKRSPFVWNSDQSWRNNYLKVDSSNREQLKREGNIRRKEQKLVESSGVNRMTLTP